jgi:hypothetical protein
VPRRARFAVNAIFFANGATIGTWAVRIPAVKHGLHLDDAELGAALLFSAAGALVSMPLAGRLVARYGSRGTTLTAYLSSCVALPLLALASSLVLLAAALFVFGAAVAATDVSMNSHGLTVERRYGRPILASFHAAFSLGGLCGAAAGGLVAAAEVGARVHLAVAGVLLALIGVAVAQLLLPASADASGAVQMWARPPRRLAVLGLLAFCCLFAEGAAADWSAVYAAGPLDAGPGVAALGFAAFSLTMTAGRLVGDRLTAHWGAVVLTRRGGALAACGLAAALVARHPAAAVVGFACVGAGLASVVPVVFRAGGSTPGIPPGVGISAVSTIGYLGFLVGPPSIGLAAKLVGLPLALGIVVVLLAMLAALASATRPTEAAA